MPRRGVWIGMAVAIPATVAFTPFHPLEPALQDPNVVAQPQPVVATTPVATAQPVVATTPVAAAPATAQNLRAGSSAMAAPDRDVGSIVVNAALTRVGLPTARTYLSTIVSDLPLAQVLATLVQKTLQSA